MQTSNLSYHKFQEFQQFSADARYLGTWRLADGICQRLKDPLWPVPRYVAIAVPRQQSAHPANEASQLLEGCLQLWQLLPGPHIRPAQAWRTSQGEFPCNFAATLCDNTL